MLGQAQRKHHMAIGAWTPKQRTASGQEDSASHWERWSRGNLDEVANRKIA